MQNELTEIEWCEKIYNACKEGHDRILHRLDVMYTSLNTSVDEKIKRKVEEEEEQKSLERIDAILERIEKKLEPEGGTE